MKQKHVITRDIIRQTYIADNTAQSGTMKPEVANLPSRWEISCFFRFASSTAQEPLFPDYFKNTVLTYKYVLHGYVCCTQSASCRVKDVVVCVVQSCGACLSANFFFACRTVHAMYTGSASFAISGCFSTCIFNEAIITIIIIKMSMNGKKNYRQMCGLWKKN